MQSVHSSTAKSQKLTAKVYQLKQTRYEIDAENYKYRYKMTANNSERKTSIVVTSNMQNQINILKERYTLDKTLQSTFERAVEMAIQHIELEDKYLNIYTQLHTERKAHNQLKELIRQQTEIQNLLIAPGDLNKTSEKGLCSFIIPVI